MKIAAVVVTYNRKKLLQECIAALQEQTMMPAQVLVVNNGSTDGTTEWLQQQNGKGLVVVNQPNRGGSWGFYTGIKTAYQQGADWVWLMDDDTIPEPDALEQLVIAAQKMEQAGEPFHFFASKAVWTDGNPHLMNIAQQDENFSGKYPDTWYEAQGVQPVAFCSFVSLLLSREAIRKAGLPVKELFIWNDDFEYTTRLRRLGLAGGYVPRSVVLHKTPTNYHADLFTDSPANLWKHRYGIRNELYVRRINKGYGSFLRNVAKRFAVLPFTVLAKRKSARWPFIKTVWQGTWQALRFNPKQEGVE
jgi:GT2 family glycosyltransferase